MSKTALPIQMPLKYADLIGMLAPRPLHDDVDYKNAIEVIDRLAGFDLTEDQEDYLEALSTFVEAYEQDQFPISEDLSPLEALKALMEQREMNASDLGRVLGQRQLGSAILRGVRTLSKAHILTLADYFAVNPALLLG